MNFAIYFVIMMHSDMDRIKSYDDHHGMDDSIKNPAVKNIKPTCLEFFTDAYLNGKI
jgi:hypothetical protein